VPEVRFFAWAAWSGSVVEGEAPRLVANVDAAVGSALDEDPGLRERLLEVSSMASFGGPDVLSVVPRVEGAEAFSFGAGEGGSAVIGYRGTSLAGGVCVRAVLSVEGRVQVERGDCGLD